MPGFCKAGRMEGNATKKEPIIFVICSHDAGHMDELQVTIMRRSHIRKPGSFQKFATKGFFDRGEGHPKTLQPGNQELLRELTRIGAENADEGKQVASHPEWVLAIL